MEGISTATGIELGDVKLPYWRTRKRRGGFVIRLVQEISEIEAVEPRKVVEESDDGAGRDIAVFDGQSREGVSKGGIYLDPFRNV